MVCGYLTGYLNSNKKIPDVFKSVNFTHKRSNTALPSSNYSQVSCTSSINLDAPILKIQKKRRKKMSNYRPWIQIYIKIQYIIYSKLQVCHLKSKEEFQISSVLSLSLSPRRLCPSRKLEREPSNLSNFPKRYFREKFWSRGVPKS